MSIAGGERYWYIGYGVIGYFGKDDIDRSGKGGSIVGIKPSFRVIKR